MAVLASAILLEARGLLNDSSGAIYPDSPMLILLNKVHKELQTKLSARGIGTSKEISATITVAAGTVALGDGSGLPTNLLYPLELKERPSGSTDIFRDMTETVWEPSVVIGPYLTYWNWREEEIKFPGATTDREVQIRFVKSLGSITTTSSPIVILNSEQWLSQRLAATAALVIGQNATRAKALNDDLKELWNDLIATMVKRKQAIPVRRKRTRYRTQ